MNPKTTIKGLISAIVIFAIWITLIAFTVVIPPEVGTFLNLIGIAIVGIWADPEGFKEISPALFGILTTILSFLFYILSHFFQIIVPELVQGAAQAIGVFLFGLFAHDAQPKT
jgi:hypothetical protein